MERKLRVGVIFGGRSGEHEVSIASAASVMAALDKEKYEITVKGLDFDPFKIDWDTQPPDNAYPFSHKVELVIPQSGTLTIEEEPIEGSYSLATMQVWSEPTSAPDHNFVCFEPVVTGEDGLNRPKDRLNIPPHTTHKLQLKITAVPK